MTNLIFSRPSVTGSNIDSVLGANPHETREESVLHSAKKRPYLILKLHSRAPPAAMDRAAQYSADGYVMTPRVEECINMPLVSQRSKEWFDLRKDKLTGSAIDAVLGNNHFQSREQVVLEKCGKPVEFTGNDATRHGQLNEPRAIEEYERRTGHRVVELGLTPHPRHSLLAHSPDGISLSRSAPPVLLEIKCPLTREITTRVPSYYMGQLQLGMEVFDVKEAHFVQYRPASGSAPCQFTCVAVHRDPDWLSDHMEAITAFWEDVHFWRSRGWEHHWLESTSRQLAYLRTHCMV